MWQTLLTPVDLYCERTGPGLWAEPANALTNLAFIVAGLWGVRQVRRYRTGSFAEVLAWWVVAIGIGSTLFHTFASKGTIWADILPIAGFTLAYTLFTCGVSSALAGARRSSSSPPLCRGRADHLCSAGLAADRLQWHHQLAFPGARVFRGMGSGHRQRGRLVQSDGIGDEGSKGVSSRGSRGKRNGQRVTFATALCPYSPTPLLLKQPDPAARTAKCRRS